MAEVKHFNTTNTSSKKPLDINWNLLLGDSVANRPPDIVFTPAEKSKGLGGDLKQPEMEEKDIKYQMKTDGELEGMFSRMRHNNVMVGPKLLDKGEKSKATLRRCIAEVERRKRIRVNKGGTRCKETVELSDESDDGEIFMPSRASCGKKKSVQKSSASKLFTRIMDDSDDDFVITPTEKSKGRGGDLKQREMEEEDTDGELEELMSRIKGEKLKKTLRFQRRKRSRLYKGDEREKEDDVKRMRDELEAEKKLTIQVQGKLIDAETKIIQLEAYVLDLHKKLCDSSAQLGVAERKCASVENDSKWLLQEGLPFLVKKPVNELSKENFMTVSELRALHQRSSRSDSS